MSCKVTPVQSSAQYGALNAGYIEIRGHMKRAMWINNRSTLIDIETEGAVGDQTLALTIKDTDEGVSTGPIHVWCLQICPYDPGIGEGPSGLILTTEDERVFRRVGMFCFDPFLHQNQDPGFHDFHREQQQKWAEECQFREIIIV